MRKRVLNVSLGYIESRRTAYILDAELLYYLKGKNKGFFVGIGPSVSYKKGVDEGDKKEVYYPTMSFGFNSTLGYRILLGEHFSLTPTLNLGNFADGILNFYTESYYTANLSLAYKF